MRASLSSACGIVGAVGIHEATLDVLAVACGREDLVDFGQSCLQLCHAADPPIVIISFLAHVGEDFLMG